MKHFASPKAMAAGCALVAATNLVIVLGAASNRRGEPEADLALTERELALPEGRQEERSGLMLELRLTGDVPGPVRRTARWRNYELPAVEYPWLDRAKLRALGFDAGLDPEDPKAPEFYERQTSRPVYLVLEYDGEAWARWLAGREGEVAELRRRVKIGGETPGALADAEAQLELDRTMRSRLFPVDAGVEAAPLRSRYDGPRRYAVVEALVRPKVIVRDDRVRTLGGEVLEPVVRWVHVPRGIDRRLDPFLPEETFRDMEMRERREAQSGWPRPVAPRYRAELAVGRRLEPWLVGMATLDREGSNPASE